MKMLENMMKKEWRFTKMEEIFKGISASASPHLGGYSLSMMPYSLPFAKKAVQDVEPFFEA